MKGWVMTTTGKIWTALVGVVFLTEASFAQGGLTAYWKFDGNYLDSSGNNYHGTAINFPGFGTGVSGQALQLASGSSQYVSTVTANLLGLTGNTFTAVAWVRPTTTSGDRSIFGTDTTATNQGLHLIIRNDRAHFGFYGNDTAGNRTIPVNQWTHLVWQFDNGRQRIIVNGQLDASTTGHANFENTSDPVLIGRWRSGNYFDGLLDEVAVYNEALSPNQVIYLAGGGDPANLPPANPFSFYPGTPTGPVLLGPTLSNGKRNAYQLVTHPEGLTWDQARVDAMQHTYMGVPGHLVTIHSPLENFFARAFGTGTVRWIGFTDSNATSLLDGATMPGGGSGTNNFQWVTGEPVTYTAWAGGEPNNAGTGEDAGSFRGDGLWNDYPAGSSLGQSDYLLTQYVIEYEVQAPGSATGVRLLPKLGPVLPNGTRNAYELVMNPSTWVTAKVDAQNRQYMGVSGHLVTLHSANEDTFVRSLGNGWIGLTDDPNHAPGAFEGGNQSGWSSPPQGSTPQYGQKGYGWAWVTGESLTYHNWNSGEPNNAGGEHYAEMTPGWNDLPNATWATRNYVVEYPVAMQANPAFSARMVQIGPGGADTQLNSAGEALSVALGFGVGSAAGNRYQVITDASHTPLEINYGSGSAGNFPMDNPYPNGSSDPGDDFTVRVASRVYIPEGQWTIGFAGDDGGYLHLAGVQFVNQLNTDNDWKTNDGTLLYQAPSAHALTIGHFVSPPGGITTTLEAMTFERSGGQHFEICIAPGHWPGYDPLAFGLLVDGQYGWRATPIQPHDGFNVLMIQLDPTNPPGFNNEIDTTQEAVNLVWNVTGPGDYNIGGQAYRVTTYIPTQSPYVDFGGPGSFNEPTLLYPNGTPDAGEDYLVAAQAFLRVPPGTWSIGFASDDGGVLRLINTHGSPIQFTTEYNTNGDPGLDDTILYNGTRGHSATWGVFTLTSEAYLELQSLFFERAGGDSFEIFIARGAQNAFNTTDFFILRNGVLGILVAPELLAVVPEPSSLALLALGGLGLLAISFRRRASALVKRVL